MPGRYSYYDHFTDSGLGGQYAQAQSDLFGHGGAWDFGIGKYYKNLLKNPGAIASQFNRLNENEIRTARENETVDPALLAANPDLVASQMNKHEQEMRVQGQTSTIRDVLGMQGQAAQARLGLKSAKAGAETGFTQSRLGTQAQMMEARRNTPWWQTALSLAAPLLSFVPGLGAVGGAAAGAQKYARAAPGGGGPAPLQQTSAAGARPWWEMAQGGMQGWGA